MCISGFWRPSWCQYVCSVEGFVWGRQWMVDLELAKLYIRFSIFQTAIPPSSPQTHTSYIAGMGPRKPIGDQKDHPKVKVCYLPLVSHLVTSPSQDTVWALTVRLHHCKWWRMRLSCLAHSYLFSHWNARNFTLLAWCWSYMFIFSSLPSYYLVI